MPVSIDVHPGGEHFLVCGHDRRVIWYDMQLTIQPYKVLRYHEAPARAVAFHKKYPLFASCSDDGTIHFFHNTVFDDDFTKDPVIIPIRPIRAHRIKDASGILHIKFHPQQPWIFSCGADKTIRLFT